MPFQRQDEVAPRSMFPTHMPGVTMSCYIANLKTAFFFRKDNPASFQEKDLFSRIPGHQRHQIRIIKIASSLNRIFQVHLTAIKRVTKAGRSNHGLRNIGVVGMSHPAF